MSNYEKQFNQEITSVVLEAKRYGVEASDINWLNVFISVQAKINQTFQKAEV